MTWPRRERERWYSTWRRRRARNQPDDVTANGVIAVHLAGEKITRRGIAVAVRVLVGTEAPGAPHRSTLLPPECTWTITWGGSLGAAAKSATDQRRCRSRQRASRGQLNRAVRIDSHFWWCGSALCKLPFAPMPKLMLLDYGALLAEQW